MRHSLITLLIFVFVGLSCKKDRLDISGYTITDGMGNIMGNVDASDWTFDANWSSKETDIISSIDPGDLTGTTAGTITIYPLYPNPCSNSCVFHFNSTTACKVRLAIVNKKGDKLFSDVTAVNTGSNVIAIQISSDKFNSGTLYRMYYSFEAQGSLMFKKGHGDIMVQ